MLFQGKKDAFLRNNKHHVINVVLTESKKPG